MKTTTKTNLVNTFNSLVASDLDTVAKTVFNAWKGEPVTPITKSELVEFVRDLKGSTFVTIQTITEVQASKAKKAQKVYKLSHLNCNFNWNYENSVNTLASKEGSDKKAEVKQRTWGKRIVSAFHSLIEHKGEYYFAMKPVNVLNKPVYFTEGKVVAKSEIEHLLRKPSAKSSTQAHLKGEVMERDYKLESIRNIAIQGHWFEVV